MTQITTNRNTDGILTEQYPEYNAQTTQDPRRADIESLADDGGYARDKSTTSLSDMKPLTKQIANFTTNNGGRISTDFRAGVQSEGYQRTRRWRVYAPTSNPFVIAAGITDILNDADGIDGINVEVNKSGIEYSREVIPRITRVIRQDDEDTVPDDVSNKILRLLQWGDGLDGEDYAKRADPVAEILSERIASDNPREALFNATDDDFRRKYDALGNYPGDAIRYTVVTIEVFEAAEDPFFG